MGIHRKDGPTAEPLLTRVSEESNRAMSGTPIARSTSIAWLKHLRGTHGTQLLEFALALPFLLAFVVGIIDFGKAYNIKHIVTNAAREGARLTSSTPLTNAACDTSGKTPCSIQASADAVKQYLSNAGLTAASCIKPNAPTSGPTSGTINSGTALTPWIYSCGGITLTINRAVNNVATSSGQTIPCTQVTVSYPYTFTFGRIIGLLVNGATGPAGQQTMTANAVMQNLTY